MTATNHTQFARHFIYATQHLVGAMSSTSSEEWKMAYGHACQSLSTAEGIGESIAAVRLIDTIIRVAPEYGMYALLPAPAKI